MMTQNSGRNFVLPVAAQVKEVTSFGLSAVFIHPPILESEFRWEGIVSGLYAN